MRIAYVNQDPGIGPERKKGAAVHVAALQRAFRALGCEVIAVEAKDDAAVTRELSRLDDASALDLVYERHALEASGAAQFCIATTTPLFLEVNAPLLDEAREHRGVAPSDAAVRAEAQVLGAAAHVFPVSNAVAQYVAQRGVARERMHVTPNGVDTDTFRPRAERVLALPNDTFVLGFHGRLRAWHNFALLAESFELLLARGRRVHLLAIGEGDFSAHLSATAQEHATHLAWMPHEQLARHVACFDALPLTYAPESNCYFSPLKLLEAMACGAVPLVPDLGDLCEVIEHGRAGLVVRAGDAHALADAVTTLIDQPQLRSRLGSAAIARARARTWTHVAREILAHAGGVHVP